MWQELSQHIGGLQSASNAQITLLRQQTLSNIHWGSQINGSSQSADADLIFTPPNEAATLINSSNSYFEQDGLSQGYNQDSNHPAGVSDQQFLESEGPAAIFEQFLFHLGPPMVRTHLHQIAGLAYIEANSLCIQKSLVYTVKLILEDLPLRLAQEGLLSINPHFKESLILAIPLYSEARKTALNTLYQTLKEVNGSKDRKEEWAADAEEIAGCCGYFSYCLEAFAQETIILLDILQDIETCSRNNNRSWKWLLVWRLRSGPIAWSDQGGAEHTWLLKHRLMTVFRNEFTCPASGFITTTEKGQNCSKHRQSKANSLHIQNLEDFEVTSE